MKLVLIILAIIFYSSVVKSETVLDWVSCEHIKKEVKYEYTRLERIKVKLSTIKERKSKEGKLIKMDEDALKQIPYLVNKHTDWLYKTATIYNAFCKK